MKLLNLKTEIEVDYRKYLVSTVDLEVYMPGGKRFETMIFGYNDLGQLDFKELYVERYHTMQKAIANHEELCKRLHNGDKPWNC